MGGVVGDLVGGVTDTISDAGSQFDDFVNEEVPGGWALPAIATAAYFGVPVDPTAAGAGGSSSGSMFGGLGELFGGGPELLGEASGMWGGAGGAGAGLLSGLSMPSMGQLGSAMQLAGSINSLTGGGITNALGGAKTVQQAQAQADPMAPYRQNLAAMYAGALQPGAETDITKMPGYSQFQTGVLDPALEAAKRSATKSGMLRSGNEQIALNQIAQQGYSGFMNDYLNRLATGAGVTQSPAAGYNAGTQAQTGIMQGLGGIGTGIAGIFGGPSKVTPYTQATYNESTMGAGGGITSPDVYNYGPGSDVPLGYANF